MQFEVEKTFDKRLICGSIAISCAGDKFLVGCRRQKSVELKINRRSRAVDASSFVKYSAVIHTSYEWSLRRAREVAKNGRYAFLTGRSNAPERFTRTPDLRESRDFTTFKSARRRSYLFSYIFREKRIDTAVRKLRSS